MNENPASAGHQAAESIFNASLELKAEERCAYLTEACGGSASLRERVEALLRAHDASTRFLPESPAATSFDALPASRVVGDYELLAEIARGGMGVVYRARQRSLDRIVAVKMILAGQFASREQALRFRAEAEAAARLQHPNIVRIHETAEHEGRPYFSMDYVEGANLSELVREKPWPARRAAGCVTMIAEAIHHAHEQGILHRDLKPSNVLIDSNDQPRVTDFGLAKRMQKESFLTVTGDVMGSPNFMPPEQAGARGAKAGRHSDVYSLGGILFYLVTGRPAFVAENVAETLHHVLNTEPVSPRLLNPSVPQDIATICLKCLEKEPAKRYPTAQQLAEELSRFLNDEPIRARPVGRAERAWRWCRRKPAFALALAVAASGLGTGGLFAVEARRAEQRRLAERRENAVEKTLITAWSGELPAAEEAIREAELAGAVVADVRLLRGLVAFHRGEYADAVRHLEQAVKLNPSSVAAQSMLSKAYMLVGRWPDAEPIFSILARLSPRTLEDYLFKGSAEGLMDPAKGLGSLDEAVRRRPSGTSRLFRGQVRFYRAQESGDLADLEAAQADAEAANVLLPGNPVAVALSLNVHLLAADLYEEHHEFEKRDRAWRDAGAVTALLAKYPQCSEAFIARISYLKQFTNDLALITDLRQSNAAAENNYGAYYLALGLYRLGRIEEATEALFHQNVTDGPWQHFLSCYMLAELPGGPSRALEEFHEAWRRNTSLMDALVFQTALRFLGRRLEAVELSRKLQEQAANLPPVRSHWYGHLLDYDSDDLSAEALLELAGSSRWNRSEAHFHIGLNRLAEGDRTSAREHFRETNSKGAFNSFDFDWSRAFLARMEHDPNWPPWIPAKSEPRVRAEP